MASKRKDSSGKLDELAAKINEGHAHCVKALRDSLEYARKAGTWLLEAKALVEADKGKWLPWLQLHCHFSVSQAQRYIRVADRYHELLQIAEDPKGLNLTKALRLLASGSSEKSGTSKGANPLSVNSQAELDDRQGEAVKLEIPADSEAGKFINDKVAILLRQLTTQARKAKLKDEAGNPADAVQVALALLERIKLALKPRALVEIAAPAAATQTGAHNGHTPKNRIGNSANGKKLQVA